MSRESFWIMAGGGVRGTAYVGVIKALEEMGIKMSGIAGTSAGAVIASLVAVGYTYSEIKDLLYSVNYQSFKDLYIPLGKDFGFFKGDGVYYWLKDKIEKKIYGESKNENSPPVTFKDLDKELVIVATDISYGEFKEYNKYKTPDVEVAHAVRSSISLPGFFKPVWENERCLIDGDVINNFPIWKTESEIIANTNLKVLEFRLESSEKPREINNIFDYLNALVDTNYNTATDLLQREFGENDQFEIIRIDTGRVKVIDFGVSDNEKQKLIEDGYNSVKRYFDYDVLEKRKKIKQVYEKTKNNLRVLKKDINRNKVSESFLLIGNLAMHFAENKEIIHKFIYRDFSDFHRAFHDGLISIGFLKLNFFKDKKEVISRIDRLINNINNLMQAVN